MEEITNREIDTIPLHPLQATGEFKFPDTDTVPDWFTENQPLDIVRMQFVINSIKGAPVYAVDVYGLKYGAFLAVTPEICGGDLTELRFRYRTAGLTHLPTGRLMAEGPPAEMHSLALAYRVYADVDDLVDASFSDKRHTPNLRLKAIFEAWKQEFKAKVDHQYNLLISSEEYDALESPTINFILRKMYQEITETHSGMAFTQVIKQFRERLFEKAFCGIPAPSKTLQTPATPDTDPETVKRIKDKLQSLHGLINGTATPFPPLLVQELELLDKLLVTAGESATEE